MIGASIPLLAAPAPSIAAQLVTVTGIKLGETDLLWNLKIEIAHARIVAVCGLFEGWTYKLVNYGEAGDYKDGGAQFSGEAIHGHDGLVSRKLATLRRFLLIERDSDTGPVAVHGAIHVAALPPDGDEESIDRDLTFTLEKASRCP